MCVFVLVQACGVVYPRFPKIVIDLPNSLLRKSRVECERTNQVPVSRAAVEMVCLTTAGERFMLSVRPDLFYLCFIDDVSYVKERQGIFNKSAKCSWTPVSPAWNMDHCFAGMKAQVLVGDGGSWRFRHVSC